MTAIFSLGAFSYSFLLILAREFGFKTGFFPVLYLIFTLVASLTSFPLENWLTKIGRKKVLEISFLFWIFICLLFLSFKNYWGIIFAFIFYGLHKGAIEPSQRASVSELAPIELGFSFGWFSNGKWFLISCLFFSRNFMG